MIVAAEAMAPTSLEELVRGAALLARVDNKYVLSRQQATDIMCQLGTEAQILEIKGRRLFEYRTRYFDTAERTSFYSSAHRRRLKFKIRSREYCDSGQCWFEVKTSGNGRLTVKDRIPADRSENNAGPEMFQVRFAEDIIGNRLGLDTRLDDLSHTLTSTYRRLTLFLPLRQERVTIDLALHMTDGSERGMALSDQVILESKSHNGRGLVDRILWAEGRRPQPISKYATGMALLDTGLPRNRWNRTIGGLRVKTLTLTHESD